MYTEHFGLTEKPFSISPDPRYLYLSQRHADALAHLIYGISESGGFIQLTGEVGTGKTTLIRSLLEQLPERTEIALVLNPPLTTLEFMQSICQELRIGITGEQTVKSLIDRLNEHLLAAHAEDRRVVLIVDEAQTLSPALLEQVRLLTNLETSKRKLLQIILIGQPELRDLLERPEMRQIAQRITGRYHLEPLSSADARVYIRHRLRVAGSHQEIFTDRAVRELYRLAGGIPRLINVLADRALLAAYTREERRIGVRLIRQAAREVFGRALGGRRLAWFAAAATTLGAVALAAGLWVGGYGGRSNDAADAGLAGNADAVPLAVPAAELVLAAAAPDDTTVGPATAADSQDPTLPLLSLNEVLAGVAPPGEESRLQTDAATALFALWGSSYAAVSNGTPCEHARTVALRCLTLPGASLADLRQIDRPAVIELTAADGSRWPAILRAMTHDAAELLIDGKSIRVSIADLAHAWYGEHWLLWRPATDVQSDLQPGMRSERVVWLRDALARLRGESPATVPAQDPALFDATLAARVREYQRSRHLVVDGVVGAQTQVVLQADLGHPGGPILTARD